jgi:hypothetical protein
VPVSLLQSRRSPVPSCSLSCNPSILTQLVDNHAVGLAYSSTHPFVSCLVSRATRSVCSTSSTNSSSAHAPPTHSIQTRTTPHHQLANCRVNMWWQQRPLPWVVCWAAYPRVAHSNLWQGCQCEGEVEWTCGHKGRCEP